MKTIFQIILVGLLFIGCEEKMVGDKVPSSVSDSSSISSSDSKALEIVNKRMAFYNEHNFEEFIKLYSDELKIYTYPERLLGRGTENIISIFKPKFASKSVQVKIVSQMENGNYVINHEIVTENGKDTKYVSIYEVKDGLITSVRFVRDK